MPSLTEQCQKFFETSDLYEVLNIERTASEKEIKKAYYKVSLLVHPDRVPENQKEIATEKFKVLAKVHTTLSDKNKKAEYDENGTIDFEDDDSFNNWANYWGQIFRKITDNDIEAYEKTYKGSELEMKDLKRSYLDSKGNLDSILNAVPFSTVEDEPRFLKAMQELIDKNEVPHYELFTNEPAQKRKRRHNKYSREALEARKISEALALHKKDKFEGHESEEEEVENPMVRLIKSLEAKYCGKEKKNVTKKRKGPERASKSQAILDINDKASKRRRTK